MSKGAAPLDPFNVLTPAISPRNCGLHPSEQIIAWFVVQMTEHAPDIVSGRVEQI
jgi:hypothetical protein